MLQFVAGLIIELLDLWTRGLCFFSSVVQLSESSNLFNPNLMRRASAGIVGQPPSVGCPDEMKAGDHIYSLCKACGEREPINQVLAMHDLSVRARSIQSNDNHNRCNA